MPSMYVIITASELGSSVHHPIVDAVTPVERRGVMVLSWLRGLMPDENKRRRRLPWTHGSPGVSFCWVPESER